MRLRQAASEGRNGMLGTVTEFSFLGESVDYQVLVDGRQVTVNENPSVVYPVGTAVRVEFDAEHGLLYDIESATTSPEPLAPVESADPGVVPA